MAVVATTTYLYVNTSLTQFFVQGSELVDRGAWSSSAFYAINDVVQIGVDQYVALAANSNAAPTSIVDENWSTLVIVEEVSGSIINAGSDWYARDLAAQAYYWGTTAYYWGTTAYQIGTDNTALIIAETGSRIADVNNIYTIIGSLSGSVYVDLAAETGSRIAADLVLTWAGTDEQGTRSYADQYLQNQIIVEQGTRSWQDQVLANAIVDEAGSRTAADATIVLFVFGSIAVDLAAETGSRIAADLRLTWAGTNEATTRQAADQQIISIVETGTNTANSAWALAQLGTIIPPLSTLPDVSVPAPTVNQVLAWSGSLWVAADTPSQVAPGAFTLFLDDTASGTAGYDTLLTNPSGNPEVQESVTVGAGTIFAPVASYLSNSINRTTIQTGIWEFNTYASTTSAGQSAYVVTDVYIRSINGVETYLFSGTSNAVTATSPQLVTSIVTTGSYATALSDKLVAKYAFLRNASPALTATLYHSGSIHDSHFHTPIGYAHNDLGGLQGGAAPDQFYHVTLDQNNALTGNSGYPSASNPFVTLAGLNYADGTLTSQIRALAGTVDYEVGTLARLINYQTGTVTSIANSAYYVAQSGSNTANDAYVIACIGTNVAMTGTSIANSAYSIAISGSTTANYAWTLSQQLAAILGLSLSGTLFLYTAQVEYGKPDTKFTIINGVVAGLSPSTWSWEDFDFYGTTSGTTPISEPMYRGTAWDSYGSIYFVNLAVGFTGTDAMNNYSTGTIGPTTLNQGTGWSTSGTSWEQNYTERFAVDGFEQYATGTLSNSGTEVNAGTNWIGSAQCYQGYGW
jgi:hypothetical protein